MKVLTYQLFAIIFLQSIPYFSMAQRLSEWAKKPSIGFYYTPLKINRYSYSSGIQPAENYIENTTNISASFPITAKIRLGAQFISVANKVIRKPVDRSYLLGATVQYNLRVQKRLGLYLESGYTFGNLCPCGNDESYSSDTINHFLPFGFGFDFRVTSNLHLKAGFINYKPLKGQSDIYNWTQPFIGVNYYLFKGYKTPFKSRFIKKSEPLPKDERYFFWEDDRQRKWNIGFTSSGITAIQNNPTVGQTGPLLKYREFTIVPRLNYWLNQSVLIGVQGTYYHYENNFDVANPRSSGWGGGMQIRFYPLSFKNSDKFRAVRIGKRANWNISPIVGAEVHVANFSWLDPQSAGKKWQYFDFQPFAGFVLSYKQWFNLVWNIGPTIAIGKNNATSPVNGVRIFGLEYNFLKKK